CTWSLTAALCVVDADSFEPDEPIKKAAGHDKWEGEDEDDDVKDNWDDEEEEDEKVTEAKAEVKSTEKKKLSDKIKEKENLQKKKQEELRKRLEESNDSTELTPEEDELAEKLRVKKLQEDSDLELAKDAFGIVPNNVTGIDAMSPSSKDDFTEFERLLKEKITSYEKSIHYSSFLESLFRDLCLSLEVEDLKKINNSLTVLLSEKQRQEKQQNKGKKKKKGVLPAGGLKAKMKDDLADYGGFDGGYVQDYEDFM
uniref:Eukaryotic translation initiation factor 3 subunit J n=1 Tax=Astyanax mexicanus TaxID=7994 RepID=A0A8B9LNZ1_ASTMX